MFPISLRTILIFAALLFVVVVECHVHSGLKGSVSFFKDDVLFDVRWTLNTSNWIRFDVRAQTSGWFAIGFNSKKGMAGADIVAFINCDEAADDEKDLNKVIDLDIDVTSDDDDDDDGMRTMPSDDTFVELCISDRFTKQSGEPPSDWNNENCNRVYDTTIVGPRPRVHKKRDGNVARVSFERKLVTGDRCDYEFHDAHLNKSAPQQFFILGALHDTATTLDKEHTLKTSRQITLYTAEPLPKDNDDDNDDIAAGADDDDDDNGTHVHNERAHIIHGAIMMICWALLSPAAVFTARYLKASSVFSLRNLK